MKKKWLKLTAPILGAALALSACGGQQGQSAAESTDHLTDVVDNTTGRTKDLNDSYNIPSQHSTKTRTTNENGESSSGMGSDVNSLIGSSGIHEGGISSHLESRLKGNGIQGVKVFVLDDTVILARTKPETTSNQYDRLQNQVLSGTSGASGKGELKGIPGKTKATDDNLVKARDQMTKMFNGDVKIMTVTDPKAVDLINQIKKNLKSASPSSKTLSDNISTLVNMATK